VGFRGHLGVELQMASRHEIPSRIPSRSRHERGVGHRRHVCNRRIAKVRPRGRDECLRYRHNNNPVAYLGVDVESSLLRFGQSGDIMQNVGTARV
jgi:hypothetical protein